MKIPRPEDSNREASGIKHVLQPSWAIPYAECMDWRWEKVGFWQENECSILLFYQEDPQVLTGFGRKSSCGTVGQRAQDCRWQKVMGWTDAPKGSTID
jgi:hypothetical protein